MYGLGDRPIETLAPLYCVVPYYLKFGASFQVDCKMCVRAGRKCKSIEDSLIRCREFRPYPPGLQVRRVVVRSRSFKVVIEFRCIGCGVRANFSDGGHQSCGASGKSVDLVRKVAISDSGCGDGCDPRHAIRALHVRNRRCEKLSNPSDVRGDVVNRFFQLLTERGQSAAAQNHKKCDPRKTSHCLPVL